MKKYALILAVLAIAAAPAMGTGNWDGVGTFDDATGLWSGLAPGSPDPPPSATTSFNVRSGVLTIQSGMGGPQGSTIVTGNVQMGFPGTVDSPGTVADAALVLTGGSLAVTKAYSGLGEGAASGGGFAADISLSGSAAMTVTLTYAMLYYADTHASGKYDTSTASITISDTVTPSRSLYQSL